MLQGLEKASEELLRINDLIISARSNSIIASTYGTHIMKMLKIFNTVQVLNAADINQKCFKDMKYGGFLTVT